jgi:DNA mismatch repair protein MutS2
MMEYPEIDLHRLTVDEAMPRLDDFLYRAFTSGIHEVSINHGKGTGVLRMAVRRELGKSSLVKSFRRGATNEGGEGVTIVRLAEH